MATVVVKHTPSGGPVDPDALVDGPTYDNDPHIVTGLEEVDNTSDADKPISTATQAALDLKAPSDDPVFTGNVIIGEDSGAIAPSQPAILTVSRNTGPAPMTTGQFGNPVAQFVGVDGASAIAGLHVFGNATAKFLMTHARGTSAAPTRTLNDDHMGAIVALGYHDDGTPGYNQNIAILAVAQEDHTASAQGTRLDFYTTPIGSTTFTATQSFANNAVTFGGARATSSPAHLTVNQATGAAPSSAANWGSAAVQFNGVDGSSTQAVITSTGLGLPGLVFGHSRGTTGSQTATQSGDVFGAVSGYAYHTSASAAYSFSAGINLVATENHTSAATGGRVDILATPTGSSSPVTSASFGGTISLNRATTLSAALTYGGVTLSNAVTGTGNMVLSTSPALTTPNLGTPSAIVLTNASGTASININGTVGATSQNTGQFTSLAYSTTLTGTSTSANALTVGRQGATDPVLKINAATASVATGIEITGFAAAGGVNIAAISSGTNEALAINAKGASGIVLGNVSTGAITLTRATTISAALTYGGVTLSNAVTGTGSMVLSTSPSLTTPSLGAATATTINGAALDNLAWTSFSPTITPFSGTITTLGTVVGRYKQIGKTVICEIDVQVTTKGTGAGNIQSTLPTNAAAFNYAGSAFEYGLTFKSGATWINGSVTPNRVSTADATGTSFLADGCKVTMTFTYEAA